MIILLNIFLFFLINLLFRLLILWRQWYSLILGVIRRGFNSKNLSWKTFDIFIKFICQWLNRRWCTRLLLNSGDHYRIVIFLLFKLAFQLYLLANWLLDCGSFCCIWLFRLGFIFLFVNVKMGGEEALLFIAFVDQVVNSCHLIMLIIINTFFGVICFETELFYHF